MEKDKISKSAHLRWVVFFCLVAIGFISIAVFYYRYEAQRIQDDKYEDLSAIAKLKADSIQNWRLNRLADVRRVPGPLVKKEIARLLQDPTNSSARAALQIQLNINRKGTVYADALFLDIKGNILLSDNPVPAPVDQATMKAIEAALKDRREVLSDFFDHKGLVYIDAVAPIPDSSGRPIAIVVLRSNAADFLYPLIQAWPTPSRTAETLLLCRDGDSVLFLNELRHRSNTALTLRFPLTDTHLPAVQAILGKYGWFHGRDYRGIDVLAITQPVPQSPWFLVAKVDADEILTEVKYRAGGITIIVILLILVAAGLISSMYRKRAEEAVRQSEEKFRNLFDNAIEGIYKSTPDGRLINANMAFARIFGYESPEEIINAVTDIASQLYVNQDDRKIAVGIFKEKGYIKSFECQMHRKDGSVFWASYDGRFTKTQDGKPCFQGFIIDITNRKQAEDALRESDSKFRAIIEASPVPNALNDEGQNITYLNAAFVKTFGYDLEDIPTLADWWPKAYPEAKYRQWVAITWQAHLDTAKHTNTPFEPMELNIQCKDGAQRTAIVSAVPLGESFKDVHLVVFYDITERKQADIVLRDRQQFIESLINLSPDIIYIFDIIERKNVYTNDGISKILGYSVMEVQEMGDQLLSILMHPEDFKTYLEETYPKYPKVKDNEPVIHQYRMKHKNGEWYWLDCSEVIYLREPDGTPRQIFGVVHDITERKQAEDELRKHRDHLEQLVKDRTALLTQKTEKLAENQSALMNIVEELNNTTAELAVARDRAEGADRLKSAFLATMSHELRTPLNSIIGFTGIVLQGMSGPLNEEQAKQLSMAKSSANHLLDLINDVLDISKIEAGQVQLARKSFDVRSVIEAALRTVLPLAAKKGLSLDSVIASDVGVMISDRRRVEQILINLVNNAVKFTEQGNVRIECRINEGRLETCVHDTGIGIKAEDVGKLFIPFSQIDTGLVRNHEGTGLGLSICRKLVEMLGGTIRVESEWGKGSAFTFTLPLT